MSKKIPPDASRSSRQPTTPEASPFPGQRAKLPNPEVCPRKKRKNTEAPDPAAPPFGSGAQADRAIRSPTGEAWWTLSAASGPQPPDDHRIRTARGAVSLSGSLVVPTNGGPWPSRRRILKRKPVATAPTLRPGREAVLGTGLRLVLAGTSGAGPVVVELDHPGQFREGDFSISIGVGGVVAG